MLTGTGPRGGKDMDKVVGTTYLDILRATLTRSDPKEFLFFNRDAAGKAAGKAFIKRLQERTVDRDKKISTKAFQTQLLAFQHGFIPLFDTQKLPDTSHAQLLHH